MTKRRCYVLIWMFSLFFHYSLWTYYYVLFNTKDLLPVNGLPNNFTQGVVKKTKRVNGSKSLFQNIYLNVRCCKACKHCDPKFVYKVSNGMCKFKQNDLIGISWNGHESNGIYLVKVNNKNTRTKCEICSELTIKTPERCSCVFIANF